MRYSRYDTCGLVDRTANLVRLSMGRTANAVPTGRVGYRTDRGSGVARSPCFLCPQSTDW